MAKAKQKTEAERLQERIERYDAQAAEIKAKAARLKARVNEEKRKKETQQKIIIGAAVQAYLAKASDAEADSMRVTLCKHLSTADAEKVGFLADPLGLLDI